LPDMKNKQIRQFYAIALLLSAMIGITIHFPMVMNYLFGDGGRHSGERFLLSFSHLGSELLITFLVAFMMFTLNYYILNPLDKHVKIKALNIILAVLLTVISVFVLNYFLFSLLSHFNLESQGRGNRDEFIYRNFFVSALVIGCVLIIRLINQKQSVQLENVTLRSEAFQSQLESLKNQLSPHFLFNSLTALKTLISETPETAQIYVNNLSKALRYTLQSNEKQLVTLNEEMEFTESYLFLVKIRFGTNLTINIEINRKYSTYLLPPLTIQTLIENAVKHNEISNRKPLNVKIQTTENTSLAVCNNIQEKVTDEEGTGIGLTNLSKQFNLLLGRDITISKVNNEFRVEVPLIIPRENESSDN
jgi:sensor histidine kinase YesM